MNGSTHGIQPRKLAVLVGLVAASLVSGEALAFQFEMDNPDVDMRWDNTVRYNVGWRMQGRNQTLADTWGLQAGEYKFDKGDIVTNRVDLLSEFDFIYKKHSGFRVSGAAWYDAAYDDKVKGNPAYATPAGAATLAAIGSTPTAYPGNKFPNSVKRWYTSSGEFLDAFGFTRFDVGDMPLDVKLGRHSIVWGESLFSVIHGVSYSQGPVDFRKGLATPGVEAKELFLPLNQLSGHLQVNDKVSLAAQYYLEWKPYRIYEGGTYFTYFDPFFQGGTNFLGTPYNADQTSGPFKVPGNRGSWGVNTKIESDTLGGTVGLYYRKFDDKVMGVVKDASGALVNAYAKDVRLWGVSLSKQMAGISFGAELVHRENTALNSVFGGSDLARGDTWHALGNALAFIGQTGVFDSATLLAELTYSRVGKVYDSTRANFNAVGYTCAKDPFGTPGGTKSDGCSTKDAWGLAMNFTPTWYQALPSVDLSMPMHYDVGLKGNSPVPFGGNENSGSWSIGLSADYMAKYKFDVAYTGYFGDFKSGPNLFGPGGVLGTVPGIGPSQLYTTNGGNAILKDRGWLSFTFKTTF